MNKILRYFFVALLAMFVGNVFAQGITIDFDNDYAKLFPNLKGTSSGSGDDYVADGDFTEVTTSTAVNGFTVTVSIAEEGKTANRIWGSSPRLRMYSGTFTVKGSGIKKIEFGVAEKSPKFNLSTTTGTLTDKVWTGNADEVVFIVGGNTQLTKIIINGDSSGEEPGGGDEDHIANTAETAYTVAKAIELIDAGKALTEEVYVKGIISKLDTYSNGSYSYWISDDGTTESAQFECYKGKGLNGDAFTSASDLKKGATVIVKGKLKKYNTFYEFDAGNILVSYDESTAIEEKHIANTEETAYTVAEAIALIDAGESLQETVFVKGIVSKVDQYKDKYHSIDYWISDDGTTESPQFECYSGKGIDGADFESIEDIQVGATVIVKGTMKKYNSTYEFNQNNELVKYDASAAGIQNLKAQETLGAIYNLAGQQVEKAQKGIYIQNGKKFVVK